MNVTIIGAGYVGLTTGVALAYLGNRVTCLDVDEHKIGALHRNEAPFYEPFLEELMALAGENLLYTSDYAAGVPPADVVFIAVGTPSGRGGGVDLRYLHAAAESVDGNLVPHVAPDGFDLFRDEFAVVHTWMVCDVL